MSALLDRLAIPVFHPGREECGNGLSDEIESIRAELLRLFNTRCASPPMAPSPSILDYGLPDWSGMSVADADHRKAIAHAMRKAVIDYEPRLRDVRVEALPSDTLRPASLTLSLHARLRSGGHAFDMLWVVAPGENPSMETVE